MNFSKIMLITITALLFTLLAVVGPELIKGVYEDDGKFLAVILGLTLILILVVVSYITYGVWFGDFK